MKKLHAVLVAAAICSACATCFAAENSLNVTVPYWQQGTIFTDTGIGNGATVTKDNDTGIGHGVIVNDDKNKDNNKNNRWKRGHGPSVNGDSDNTIKTKHHRHHHNGTHYWDVSEEDYLKNKDNIQQNGDYQKWRARRGKVVIANNDH
jgi:hypothetical protein